MTAFDDIAARVAARRNALAARRASLNERLARARGNYERDASDGNYRALFEAENAWLRLRVEDMEAELAGWRSMFARLFKRIKEARRGAAAGVTITGGERPWPEASTR